MYLVAFFEENEKKCNAWSLNTEGATVVDCLEDVDELVNEQYKDFIVTEGKPSLMYSQIFELKHIGEVETRAAIQSEIRFKIN
jgi:hypothetical protein